MKLYGLFFTNEGKPHTLLCERLDATSSIVAVFMSTEDAESYLVNNIDFKYRDMFVIHEIDVSDIVKTRQNKKKDLGSSHKLYLELLGDEQLGQTRI